VATRPDYSLVAKPGEVVVLWGNGFGPTIPGGAARDVHSGDPDDGHSGSNWALATLADLAITRAVF
jgi:hypothetical protein